MAVLLELEQISKQFGGLQVLSSITFNVQSGEIVGLLGPNGAGKTTLFNIITGVYCSNSGQIQYLNRDIGGLKPHQICKSGIARTFQLVRTFPSMTVLENVLVGSVYGKKGGKKEAYRYADECLAILNLSDVRDKIVSRMTYSDRRLVEIARAIAAKPGLVLLDEPLAGLNPSETDIIMSVIEKIRNDHGISILWIEHKIDAIFNLCDRVIVLDHGSKIADGRPDEVAKDKNVVEAYLGEPVA